MTPPSPWIERWAHLMAPGGSVLDVAAGGGRHTTWLAARGHAITAVDRDAAAMASLKGIAAVVAADIEAAPWPLAGRRFDAVVVTNYLWRPLLPTLTASLAEGGVGCGVIAPVDGSASEAVPDPVGEVDGEVGALVGGEYRHQGERGRRPGGDSRRLHANAGRMIARSRIGRLMSAANTPSAIEIHQTTS